jgi:hypothetical protein
MHFHQDKRWKYWYDKSIKSWVVQELDEDSNQIHYECEYFAIKKHLLKAYPSFQFVPQRVEMMSEIQLHLLRHYISKGKRWKVRGLWMSLSYDQIRDFLSDNEWREFQWLLESASESL